MIKNLKQILTESNTFLEEGKYVDFYQKIEHYLSGIKKYII